MKKLLCAFAGGVGIGAVIAAICHLYGVVPLAVVGSVFATIVIAALLCLGSVLFVRKSVGEPISTSDVPAVVVEALCIMYWGFWFMVVLFFAILGHC